jgi:hypothetical protein
MAHAQEDKLVADSPEAKHIFEVVGPAEHVNGDIFQGHSRRNIPESEKPAPAQRSAQRKNIQKKQSKLTTGLDFHLKRRLDVNLPPEYHG